MLDRERTLYAIVLKYCRLLAADVPEDRMAEQPAPGMNHPAWILGHLVIATDFAAGLLGEKPLCPPDWRTKFGPGSTVLPDRDAYTSKSELLASIAAGHARVAELAANTTAERLDRPQRGPFLREEFPLIGDILAHLMTTHPCAHLGQLSAWRRMIGLPGVLKI